MGWTAPDVVRVDEPFLGPERPMLDGWLAWHRTTFLTKCAGLTGEQLAQRAVPPSGLSLLGLVRHHTDVERTWIRGRFLGEPVERAYYREGSWDHCFDDIDPARAEEEYAALVAEQERAARGWPSGPSTTRSPTRATGPCRFAGWSST